MLLKSPCVSACSWRRSGSLSLSGTTICFWKRYPALWGPEDRPPTEMTTHTGGKWGPPALVSTKLGRTLSIWLQGLSRRVAQEPEWGISVPTLKGHMPKKCLFLCGLWIKILPKTQLHSEGFGVNRANLGFGNALCFLAYPLSNPCHWKLELWVNHHFLRTVYMRSRITL